MIDRMNNEKRARKVYKQLLIGAGKMAVRGDPPTQEEYVIEWAEALRMQQVGILEEAIEKIEDIYAAPNYQETLDRSKLHQSEGAYGAIGIIKKLMEDVR